jgi:hypothetical protein
MLTESTVTALLVSFMSITCCGGYENTVESAGLGRIIRPEHRIMGFAVSRAAGAKCTSKFGHAC